MSRHCFLFTLSPKLPPPPPRRPHALLYYPLARQISSIRTRGMLCFCPQSFNERKWNTSPSPSPSTINCTTQRGRRSDWPPARQSPVIKWKRNFVCVSETTSSFAGTIVRPLPLFIIVINGWLIDQILVHVFVQLYFTRTLLMTTYDGDIRNKCRLHKLLMTLGWSLFCWFRFIVAGRHKYI